MITDTLTNKYNQAFNSYPEAFWNMRKFDLPTIEQICLIPPRLRKYGGIKGRILAEEIEEELNAIN